MTVSRKKLAAVAIGAFLMLFCNGIINNSTTYFILSVTDYLNITKTTFSVYFTIITVCSALMSLVVMPIAEKLGTTKSAFVSMIGVGCGFFILSRLTTLWMVYVGALFIGIFQSFVVVPAMSVLNKWFIGKNTNAITGFVMSATGFGGLTMGAVMPSVVRNFSWRTGYMFCLVIWLCITFLISILTSGEPPKTESDVHEVPSSENAKSNHREYIKLVSSPGFILFLLTAGASAGITTISQHMSVLLEINGMSTALVSLIMSMASITVAVSKIVIGSLFDRFPLRTFVPTILLIGAAGYFLLSQHNTIFLLLGVIGYGISASTSTVLYPGIMRQVYGREMTTATWGICWAMFMIGQAVWTPLYAWIFDKTGSYNTGVIITSMVYILLTIYMVIILKKST